MIKKFLSGLLIIFAFIFTFTNFVRAESVKAGTHWNKKSISVYIPKDAKSMSMRRAFEKWQNLSSNAVNFKFVNKGPADIDVVFVDKVDGSDGPIGSYKLTIKKGYITKAEIKMATRSNKKYSNNLVYTTMLHEVGHALGLPDENRKRSSIMYMPVSESQDILKLDLRNLYTIYGLSWKERRFNN